SVSCKSVSLAAENLRDNVLKIASEFTSTPLPQCRLVDGAVECSSRSIPLSELFESVPDARHRLSVMRKAYGSPRTTCFNVHGFRIAVNRITGEIRILQSVHAAAVLIATVKLRPGMDAEFTAWKAHSDLVVGKFPGFVGSDIIPPTRPDSNEWTIILNFRSNEDLVVWQKSKERVEIIAEGVPLFEGGNFGEVVQTGESGDRTARDVTEVIFSKIKFGKEDTYREWAARMQCAQAKYPGYKGTFLQPPHEKGGFWTTIMRFDSASHLEGWMNAPERKEMLSE